MRAMKLLAVIVLGSLLGGAAMACNGELLLESPTPGALTTEPTQTRGAAPETPSSTHTPTSQAATNTPRPTPMPPGASPTAAPSPTLTITPTDSPQPTFTLEPTATPIPISAPTQTITQVPTAMPIPTNIPTPTATTPVERPTPSPISAPTQTITQVPTPTATTPVERLTPSPTAATTQLAPTPTHAPTIPADDDRTNWSFGVWTLLHRAVFWGHVSEVEDALNDGADIQYLATMTRENERGTSSTYEGLTPLHVAGLNPNPAVSALLIDRGARINEAAARGITPLHWGVAFGAYEVVELLLDRGANIEAELSSGLTALGVAVVNTERILKAELLLNRGANVNSGENSPGGTPLHAAVRAQNPLGVQLLLDHGADVEAENANGETPCLQALWDFWGDHPLLHRICPELALRDVIVWITDTPLHRAAYDGTPADVATLLDQGQDIHSRATVEYEGARYEGMTPLHIAVLNPDLAVAGLLLDRGANINLTTSEGMNPTVFAAVASKGLALDLLESRGGRLQSVPISRSPTPAPTPPPAASFSWVQDGLTEIEQEALGHLQTIEDQQPVIAPAILGFAWVADGITDMERQALSYFEVIGGELQIAFENDDDVVQEIRVALSDRPWLDDGISPEELNLLRHVSEIREDPWLLWSAILTLPDPAR